MSTRGSTDFTASNSSFPWADSMKTVEDASPALSPGIKGVQISNVISHASSEKVPLKSEERLSCEEDRCDEVTKKLSLTAKGDKRSLFSKGNKEQENAAPPSLEKRVFVDAAAMKEKVRQNLVKKRYAVTDYYKTEGCWQKVARAYLFENTTLGIIAFNAIWIAVDTDFNDEEMLLNAHPIFQVAEHLFCTYFSFEWLVRFMSFKYKRDCAKDAWFVFDSLLVLSMVLETWVLTLVTLTSSSGSGGSMGNASILRIARLLRLSRMARMARLLRAMPELMVLIKGMLAATRSVFFTLCLLVLIIYVFAIAFTQLCADTDVGQDYFSTVPSSMYTLLVHGALLDEVSGFAAELGEESIYYNAVFFFFSLLAALTVMNMLIGVLCEVVSAVAATEKESMMVSYVNDKLREVLDVLDTDGSGQISKKEFVEILENVDAARALQEVGVDVVGLIDFADFIFEDDNVSEGDDAHGEKELSFSDFMEVVLQLRGSNNATVKDIVDLRKFMRRALSHMNTQIHTTQKTLMRKTMQQLMEVGSATLSGHPSNFSHRSAPSTMSMYSSLSTTAEPPRSPSHSLFDSNIADAGSNHTQTETHSKRAVSARYCDKMGNSIPASDAHVDEPTLSFAAEHGDSPRTPFLTPGVQLLHCRDYEYQPLFSVQSVSSLPPSKDLVALKGRWLPIEHDIAKDPDSQWCPLEDEIAREADGAHHASNGFWNHDGAFAPIFIEMDELRGRMAHIFKFLSAGLDEFQKLQEGLDREIPRAIKSSTDKPR